MTKEKEIGKAIKSAVVYGAGIVLDGKSIDVRNVFKNCSRGKEVPGWKKAFYERFTVLLDDTKQDDNGDDIVEKGE